VPRQYLADLGLLDPDGNPLSDEVVRACAADGSCAYYRYFLGTSGAAPVAAGVAAIIAAKYGRPDPARPGELRADPALVERKLEASARKVPCPAGGSYTYTLNNGDPQPVVFTAVCETTPTKNGFYGHGVVNAWAALWS
jgi:subtilisin family serine protease